MAVSSVELIINASKAVTALRQVDKEGRKLQQVMTRTQGAMYNLGIVGKRAADRLSGGFRGAARNAKDLNDSLSGLRGGLARLGGAVAAKEIIETGVSAIESARRIKLLTAASGDTAEALAIAERASKKFGLSQTEANVGVARLLARLKPMGMSLETIESTFVGFNTAARLAGATASESAGAFLQLTQALGSGVLRGQELNSILEQAPLIAQAIAQEMGVTVGALKKLGEEGKILAPVVIRALSRVGREGAGQLAEALKGPGQQFRNLSNAAVAFSDTATQKLLPAILPVVNAATELLKGFVALPEPVKAVIVGTAALGLAFAALPPAILLVKGALVALKVAFLAFPFVAAAAGLVAIGVAAAGATKKIAEFNELTTVNSNSVDELQEQAKKLNEQMEKLEPKTKRNGREALIAAKKYDKLADALDKVKERTKVLSQEFVIAGIKYDANMVPIDPPETVSQRNERLAPKPETEAERKARLRREEKGRETAGDIFTEQSRSIKLLTEQSELGKTLLDIEFRRADELERINNLEGITAERRQQIKDITEKAFDAERGSAIGTALGQDLQGAIDLKKAREDAMRPLVEEAELLQAKLDGNEKEVQLKQEVDRIMRSVEGLNRADVEAQVAKVAGLQDQVTEAQRLETLFESVGQTIQAGLVQGIQDAITGSKSLGESLSGILKQVGGMFLSAGIGSFGSDGEAGTGLLGALFKKRAAGGYITSPEFAQIGEGGEPEYVIPSSKMNEAMGRYARGARGGAVIPDGPGGGASGGMTGGGGSIDVSYSVERINNVNYVTAAEFERGMAQAAKRGAELGRRNVYSDLVNKRSVRSRVGV